jgi:hypothetical protein
MQDIDVFDMTVRTMTDALGKSVQHPDWLHAWRERLTTLQRDRAAFKAKIAEVMGSPDYTQSGRQKRIGELQATMAERLQAEARHLQGYTDHIATLRRSAKPTEKPNELGHVLRYLQLQEIRQDIKRLDPLEIRAIYESKLASEPSESADLWLAAVEESPQPLLPGEILDRGKERRALRALDPETRQKLADLEALKSAHEHFISLAQRELPADDPLARQAVGEVSPEVDAS